MTKVTCDRCGAELPSGPPEYCVARVYVTKGCIANMKHSFDLCQNCRAALVLWIREGVKDDQI